MTRLLTIIALLFATPAWAGEVDGHAFLCNPVGGFVALPVAVEFQHDLATIYSEVFGEQPSKYVASDSYVSWNVRDDLLPYYYKLNRKSLVLTTGKRISPANPTKWQCEFMSIVIARVKVAQSEAKRAESEANRKRKAREGNQF